MQMLLHFAQELDCKPVPAEDLPRRLSPPPLASFEPPQVAAQSGTLENFPLSTQVYSLSKAERACPCRGLARKQISAEKAGRWSICPATSNASSMWARNMSAPAARRTLPPASKQRKGRSGHRQGLAGPGLLACISTSKCCDSSAVLAGRNRRAAWLRDLAGHAVSVMRRCGRLD